MSKPRLRYFAEEDILHLIVSDEPESTSIELGTNITAELNEQGEVIGIEILDASTFLRDTILDGVQAKALALAAATEAAPHNRTTG